MNLPEDPLRCSERFGMRLMLPNDNDYVGVSVMDTLLLEKIVTEYDVNDISDDKIIELVIKLADSGEKYSFGENVYDFASTGGPSSLSTLIVPLFLYGMGASVINLAVPGRPAGAVDVLAQIHNYDLNVEIEGNIDRPFYVHLSTSKKIAPLDEKLFMYRKSVNKVDVSNLVIASILSKKIASGATDIGLEIRCSNFGNFGKTWEQCVENAKRYNRIAKKLNLNSICFVTDGQNPYQRYIGRGESLMALHSAFENTTDCELNEHIIMCQSMAEYMINRNISPDFSKVDIKKIFESNLIRQKSSLKSFENVIMTLENQQTIDIEAQHEGYIYYDLKEIRKQIVAEQNKRIGESLYPDPCGVTLLKSTGEYVVKGTPIMRLRQIDEMVCLDTTKMYMIKDCFMKGIHHDMEVIY